MPRRQSLNSEWAAPPVRALPPKFMGQRPDQGLSPKPYLTLTARHSRASHQAAEPEVEAHKLRAVLMLRRYLTSGGRAGLEAHKLRAVLRSKTVSHIRRQSRRLRRTSYEQP